MPLGLATLPLGPEQLRALAEGRYTIIDHAARTPGLLIVQAPDDQATGDERRATVDGPGPAEDAQTASGVATANDLTPDA